MRTPRVLAALAAVLLGAVARAEPDQPEVVFHDAGAKTDVQDVDTDLRTDLADVITATESAPDPLSNVARPTKGETPRTIFVIGPEASGTKFMARSIAKMFDEDTTWDGGEPACWTHENVHVQHISLPMGGTCGLARNLVARVDMCRAPPAERFFTDIVETLRGTPNSQAVILTREPNFALRSVLKGGCSDRNVAVGEADYALNLIRNAVNSVSVAKQIMHLQYESLDIIPEYSWGEVLNFLGFPHPDKPALRAFQFGNV